MTTQQFLLRGKKSDIQEYLQSDLNLLERWFIDNKLTLNTEKTKWMLVGNSRLLKKCNDFQLSISNSILERVTSYQYLGVFIDEFLSWKIQINTVN